MDLVPLGDRVLIQPDAVATTTASGLALVEHWPDEVSGRVVAVGRAKHPRKDEAFAAADALESACEYGGPEGTRHSACDRCEAAQLLRDLTGREPAVAVGERVVFSRAAGQDVQINDTRYFLMRETDLLAVIEEAA